MKINFDMDLLRTLIAFADTGSFKGAAQLVCRTQPTISMQMKRLEELVGHNLFEKKGRDLVFTEEGNRLAIQARQILALHDSVVDEWHKQEAVEGHIKLGIPDDYTNLVLPHVLEKFSERYNKISLEVVTNTSPVLTRLLQEGNLDMAVLATKTPEEQDVVLRREEIVWVTSPEHDTHRKSPLPLALFSDESPVYKATLASLQKVSLEAGNPLRYKINVTSKSWGALTAAAAHGYAVTTMARSVVPDTLRVLSEEDGFPSLGHVTLVLRGTPDTQSIATSHLAQKILDFFRLDTRPQGVN